MKLVKHVADIPLIELPPGKVAIITKWPTVTWTGFLAQRSITDLILIGQHTRYDGFFEPPYDKYDKNRYRARILQPGEQVEVT